MKEIKFAEIGCRRLISDSILLKATSYINNIDDLEAETVFDLCGCIFAYNLSKLLEAFIKKANSKAVALTIRHSYVATDDQITSYLSKEISLITQPKSYNDFKATLLEHCNITFSIAVG